MTNGAISPFGEQVCAERGVAAGEVVEHLAHRVAVGLDLPRAADLAAQRRRYPNDSHAWTPLPLQNST